jgi:hypothetical protein
MEGLNSPARPNTFGGTPSGVELLRVPLYTQTFLGIELGPSRVAGVEESGLFKTHDWDGQPARWTNGEGYWTIPIKANEHPEILSIDLVSSGPREGAERSVAANGRELLREILPRGKWNTQLPLDGVPIGEELNIVLKSKTFVPTKRNSHQESKRELGVALSSLLIK